MDRRTFLIHTSALPLAVTGPAPGMGEAPAKKAGPRLSQDLERGRGRGGEANSDLVTLFLCGDVMLGRGIDQVLPTPGDPRLYESYVRTATRYVQLAEGKNGPIPGPVDFAYVWGDALEELDRMEPDVRIVNLETAVTTSDDRARGKAVLYRMHPANVLCLTAAGIDCCTLANNHVLDWGTAGLQETMDALAGAGIRCTGAGNDLEEATTPAWLDAGTKGRVVVFSFGTESAGIPGSWGATESRPGVNLLPGLSRGAIRSVAERVRGVKGECDVIVASIHWGGNWGYEVPLRHREFARGLIDEAGVDIVHGHSCHHPRGIEVYRGRLILYGCGDFLNDYEGIPGYEEFRDDLVLMYFPSVDPADGALISLRMAPLQIRRFRLNRAPREDADWLRETLDRECQRFAARVESAPDGGYILRWD